MKIFEQGWTARALLQAVLVVGDRHALGCGQRVGIALRGLVRGLAGRAAPRKPTCPRSRMAGSSVSTARPSSCRVRVSLPSRFPVLLLSVMADRRRLQGMNSRGANEFPNNLHPYHRLSRNLFRGGRAIGSPQNVREEPFSAAAVLPFRRR